MITISSTRSALVTALLALSLAVTLALPAPAVAATTSAPVKQAAATSAPQPAADANDASDASDADSENWHGDDYRANRHSWRRHGRRGDGNDLVGVGHDSILAEGLERDSVVAVLGSASNYGTAHQDVVSVLGDTTIKGPAGGSAVAVLGNVTVDNDVGQDVVAVLGNVNLGPGAHVHGHVVSVLGTVIQDPAAIVEGGIERILPENLTSADGIRNWVGHGLMLGRPLVLGTGLSWLWTLSIALLAIYIILALLFRDATDHCIATLNDNPGKSFVTAILAVLLTPLMLVLLVITVIGIPVIPIFLVTLLFAGIFGKVTVLGWIGGRCMGRRPGQTTLHPALAVLMGGIVVMLAYLVPVLGFVVFILLSMIGYGAVLYALLNRFRRSSTGTTVPNEPAQAAYAGAASAASAASSAPSEFAPASADAGAAHAAGEAAAAATAAPAPLPLNTLPRPGFWPRMGALFIDSLVVGVLIRLLLDWNSFSEHRVFLLGLAIYGAVMWKVKGTTLGGIVFDMRVVRLDQRPLDWPTVGVRALGCILSLCALGLGFFWIGIDPGKQAWHDKLAGTIVVRVPKGTPLV